MKNNAATHQVVEIKIFDADNADAFYIKHTVSGEIVIEEYGSPKISCDYDAARAIAKSILLMLDGIEK